MSRNVDFVRSICKDWERGQFDLLGWAHAEIEFVVADGPEPMRLRGLRAMLQHWREFLRVWDGNGIAVDEYRELDEHRVLVITHAGHGRANAGGLDVQRPVTDAGAQVFDIQDGMVTRLATYFTRERALSDLGLQQ